MKHKRIRYCARGIILNQENKILLGRERRKSGRCNYKMPGGGVEGNETLEETLKNEVLEEVGVEITNIESLDYVRKYGRRYWDHKTGIVYKSLEDHWFVADYVKDNPRLYDIEGDGLSSEWVTIDEAIEKLRTNPRSIYRRATVGALYRLKERRSL